MMDSPRKRYKIASSKERTCIICSKNSSESELAKPRDEESLNVLLNAARIQNFVPITDGCDEQLYYHRDCRSNFTHKKTLEKFLKEPEPGSSSERRKSFRGPSITSRVLDPECIFCEKKNK